MALLHPDSDLSLGVIAQGAAVLRLLGRETTASVDFLLEKFMKHDHRRTPENFFSTLDMLYSLEAIEVLNYRVRLLRGAAARKTKTAVVSLNRDLFEDGNA